MENEESRRWSEELFSFQGWWEKLCELSRVWCLGSEGHVVEKVRQHVGAQTVQLQRLIQAELPARSRTGAAAALTAQVRLVLASVTRLTLLNNSRSGRLVGETERKKRGLEVEVEKGVKTDWKDFSCRNVWLKTSQASFATSAPRSCFNFGGIASKFLNMQW